MVMVLSIWMSTNGHRRPWVRRLRLTICRKRTQQSSLLGLFVRLCILLGLGVSPSTSFGLEGWIESSDSSIFFDRDSVSAVGRIRVAGMRHIKKICVLFAQKIFEKRINMHGPHPSFQSDRILLYFLYRLSFGHIRWFDTKILRELAPCFDLFGIELDDEFPQSECFELFIVASGRSIELSPQCARVNIDVEMRIAVQDEGYVSICNVFRIDVLGR
jgi:hypothetical protein